MKPNIASKAAANPATAAPIINASLRVESVSGPVTSTPFIGGVTLSVGVWVAAANSAFK